MTTVNEIVKWCMIDWLSNSNPQTRVKKRVALQMSILSCIMIMGGCYYG